MSYGHADELAGRPDPVDPALLAREDMRAFLAAQDVGACFRILTENGWTQNRIAKAARMHQSEISEIIKGRQVIVYRVLARIANGLGIPRELMCLGGSSQQDTYAGDGTVAKPLKEADEEMKRRALIAATSMAALGQAVQGLGELTELALPSGEPLPSRLGLVHVHTVEVVTQRLRSVGRQFGGQADLYAAAVAHFTRWLGVPGTDAVQARFGAALAELHTEAGWACYDSGLDGRGHFTRALRLADDAGDGYGIVNAAWHAGATLVRSGQPDGSLKCFQLGGFALGRFQPGKSTPATIRTDDPRIPTLTAWLNLNSATAYALMNQPDQAKRVLAQAHDGWDPREASERAAMDRATAGIHLDLRQFDTAAQFAANAVRTYGDGERRGRTLAELTLAELHVRTGDSRGLALARQAIGAVSTLHSVAARRERLLPLAAALQARPSNEAHELAHTARQIAAE